MVTRKVVTMAFAVMLVLILGGRDLKLSSDPPKKESPTYYKYLFRNDSSVRVTVSIEGDTFGINPNREGEHVSLEQWAVYTYSPNTVVAVTSGYIVAFYDRY